MRSLAAASGDVERLQALGLLDAYEDLADPASAALADNPLVRPRLAPSSAEETAAHARSAVRPLFRAWGGEDRMRRPPVCDGELMRLALLAEDACVLAACSIGGMDWLSGRFAFPAAAAWGRRAIEILDDAGPAPPIGLLRRTGEACQTTGDTDAATGLFARAMTLLQAPGTDVKPFERGSLLLALARLLQSRGELDKALRLYEQVHRLDRDRGQEVNAAVVRGEIPDVLHDRGDLDEALRIHREEELPVYERLGDVRAKAVTMGKIADVLHDRGDLDEALRILREEELPVYERLGDVRAKAVTMGKIADVLFARGDLAEALRIRREEELPVYERLGDVRTKAVTLHWIAWILAAKGDRKEGIRLIRDEVLPVYEKLNSTLNILRTQRNLAILLLQQEGPQSVGAEARRLLCLALADARRLRVPEAQEIQGILERYGLTCD